MVRDVVLRDDVQRTTVAVGEEREDDAPEVLLRDRRVEDAVRGIRDRRIVRVELGRDPLHAARVLGVGRRRYRAPPLVRDSPSGEDREVSPGPVVADLSTCKPPDETATRVQVRTFLMYA